MRDGAGAGMPEFEMPPEPLGPPPAPSLDAPSRAVADAPVREARTAAAPERGGRRFSLRALAAVGAAGVVAGALLPGGIEIAERAAAAADRSSLEQAALDYATAIAEGRALDAAALVAPPSSGADLLVDAVLAAGTPLAEPSVSMVLIDGDEGRVDLGYRVARSDLQRTLEAEREGGGWRITTPLVERVEHYDATQMAAIGGVPLPAGPLLLYPGVYEVAGVDSGIVTVRAAEVRVDGDPATMTDMYLETSLRPDVEAEARTLAERVAAACVASGECPGVLAAPGAEPQVEQVYVQGRSDLDGVLGFQLAATVSLIDPADPSTASWVDVGLQLSTGEDGQARDWTCFPPGAPAGAWGSGDGEACVP